MSTSSLLSRSAISGSSGPSSSIDDQNGYYHISREIANFNMLSLADGNHHNQSYHRNRHTENYQQQSEESINRNILHENLYSNNHPVNNDTSSLLTSDTGDDPFYGNNRRSVNMTETVSVPSSEHVAEIVGRQGCKIKSLRTQTNTYIKTPVRGAEPIFVVTGRKEDVAQAKHQIISAAEHFSALRASRKTCTAGSQASSNSGTSSPTSMPGHTTMQVRVPYKVVGLVVGPKGATIKRIQQTTSTYIVTPGRDKDPVFDVTGLPENVEKAKEEIEKHIASRTGTDNNSDLQIDDFQVNGIDSGYHDQSTDSASSNGQNFTHYSNNVVNRHDNLPPLSTLPGVNPVSLYQSVPPSHMNSLPTSVGNLPTAVAMKISEYNALPPRHQYNHYNPGFKPSAGSEYDVDEGIGTSGSTVSICDQNSVWSESTFSVQRSNSISVSGPRILPAGEDEPHPRTRRTNSDPLAAAFQRIDAAFSSSSPSSSHSGESPGTSKRNCSPLRPALPSSSALPPSSVLPSSASSAHCGCHFCGRQVTTALVPCGHNSFCLGCADEVCRRELERRLCPICLKVAEQAILIHN